MINENNINKNIPPFYVGQKVVYITGFNMPKDSVHTVLKVLKEHCGCWRILIETTKELDLSMYTHIKCWGCGMRFEINLFSRSWYASSFKPLEEQTFPLLSYSKVREETHELVSSN